MESVPFIMATLLQTELVFKVPDFFNLRNKNLSNDERIPVLIYFFFTLIVIVGKKDNYRENEYRIGIVGSRVHFDISGTNN